MTKEVSERCFLLELPAELRNCIIELYLKNDGNYIDEFYLKIDCPSETIRVLDLAYQNSVPNLALVNRQLRTETLPLFYSLATLDLGHIDREEDRNDAQRWLRAHNHYLKHAAAVSMQVCEIHYTKIIFLASSGKPTCCVIRQEHVMSWDKTECRMLRKYRQAGGNLNTLCENAGLMGLTAEDYIRAIEMFLAVPKPYRNCKYLLDREHRDLSREDEYWSEDSEYFDDGVEITGKTVWSPSKQLWMEPEVEG